MSLRNWFAKLPVPHIMIQHGKSGLGQSAVIDTTSSNGKLYTNKLVENLWGNPKGYQAFDDGLPFVVIKKPEA